MSRVEENKLQKRISLMNTAFQLFTDRGFAKTSIADIAEMAGVAKGTFYLYFKDKFDLREKLIAHKSEQLFRHALDCPGFRDSKTPEEKILAVTDDILFQLQKDKFLVQFIGKNLSWGVFRRALSTSGPDYISVFQDALRSVPADKETHLILIYTIIELIGSTCHSVILYDDPVDLTSYLPYLHRSILAILHSFEN